MVTGQVTSLPSQLKIPQTEGIPVVPLNTEKLGNRPHIIKTSLEKIYTQDNSLTAALKT